MEDSSIRAVSAYGYAARAMGYNLSGQPPEKK